MPNNPGPSVHKSDPSMWIVLIVLAIIVGWLHGHNRGFDDGVTVGESRVRTEAFRSAVVCNIWFGQPKEPDFACDRLNEIAKGGK